MSCLQTLSKVSTFTPSCALPCCPDIRLPRRLQFNNICSMISRELFLQHKALGNPSILYDCFIIMEAQTIASHSQLSCFGWQQWKCVKKFNWCSAKCSSATSLIKSIDNLARRCIVLKKWIHCYGCLKGRKIGFVQQYVTGGVQQSSRSLQQEMSPIMM